MSIVHYELLRSAFAEQTDLAALSYCVGVSCQIAGR
jgi:hypothetical protein